MYKFDKGKHSVYTLNYHLIQCVKYRQKVLTNEEIINELKERTKKIAERFGIIIVNQECDIDHTHILLKTQPQNGSRIMSPSFENLSTTLAKTMGLILLGYSPIV